MHTQTIICLNPASTQESGLDLKIIRIVIKWEENRAPVRVFVVVVVVVVVNNCRKQKSARG